MLVSDKYKFIVANPPKTGTTSIHGLVDRWLKVLDGDPATLGHLRGERITRHRLAPPMGKVDYSRIMVVRHPIKRLTSMYEFFRLRTTDAKWIAPQIQMWEKRYGREEAWRRFVERLVMMRRHDSYWHGGVRGVHGINPYMWADNQLEMLRYIAGVDVNGDELPWYSPQTIGVVRLESFGRDWQAAMTTHGTPVLEQLGLDLPRRNAVPDGERLFSTWEGYMAVAGVEELVHEYHGGEESLDAQIAMFG